MVLEPLDERQKRYEAARKRAIRLAEEDADMFFLEHKL